MRKWVVILIAVAIISPIVIAQTELNPSNPFTFTVAPLVLDSIPTDAASGDYCGNPNKPDTLFTVLGLKGTGTSLNVRWSASTPDKQVQSIGVTCYLNCGDPDKNIDTNCAS